MSWRHQIMIIVESQCHDHQPLPVTSKIEPKAYLDSEHIRINSKNDRNLDIQNACHRLSLLSLKHNQSSKEWFKELDSLDAGFCWLHILSEIQPGWHLALLPQHFPKNLVYKGLFPLPSGFRLHTKRILFLMIQQSYQHSKRIVVHHWVPPKHSMELLLTEWKPLSRVESQT